MKRLQRYEEAMATYKTLSKEIFRAETKTLIRSVFSLITLFTLNDKEKQSEQIDNLKTLMDFYGVPPSQQPIAQYYVEADGWRSDRIDEVVKSLKNRSFFSRFSQQHIKHFLKFMRCKKVEKGQVVFVDSQVHILLDGLIYMKSHSEEVIPPKMLAKL